MLCFVVDKLSEILDQGGDVHTIYFQFAKDFDSVLHERQLLERLSVSYYEAFVMKKD